MAGLSATAPLSPTLGLYGSFGLGKLKPTGSSTEKYDADWASCSTRRSAAATAS